MKKILLILGLTATVSFGQTKTTTQNGDFWNPFVWDCTCLPADGDSLVINHTINMSTGIPYTMGQIKINASGTLTDGGVDQDIYINGGTLLNYGTMDFDGLLLDSGFVQNNGVMNMDSLWTRDNMTNNGEITVFDFAHDEAATYTNSGTITITNNFNNQGYFINSNLITVGTDCSNCNIQSLDATFENNGILCIDNDFLNCGTDTLTGTGTIYIGGASSNLGEVKGTLTINTPGGAFSLNTGNIQPGVTFGTAACGVGLDEVVETINWKIYPNPTSNLLNSTEKNINYTIYDLSGRVVLHGTTFNGIIHVDGLSEGTYTIQMINEHQIQSVQTFIKR